MEASSRSRSARDDDLTRSPARMFCLVEEVRQKDDTHMHWVAEFGGSRHEWDAEITEQKPDERVAWRNTDGKDNAGVVTFHRIAIGAPDRRVKGDLERFKELIEGRGGETGAWRGELKRPDEA